MDERELEALRQACARQDTLYTRILCARHPPFGQALALLGQGGLTFSVDHHGMPLDGTWDQASVRARLGLPDNFQWWAHTTYLEQRGWFTWCFYAAPGNGEDDAWRDEVLDGHWAEGSIKAEGVLYLWQRYGG